MKTENDIQPPTLPALDSASGSVAARAEEGRKKLRAWAKKSKHKAISFTIMPGASVSLDETINEVANALEKYEEEKAAGTLKHERNIKL